MPSPRSNALKIREAGFLTSPSFRATRLPDMCQWLE